MSDDQEEKRWPPTLDTLRLAARICKVRLEEEEEEEEEEDGEQD